MARPKSKAMVTWLGEDHLHEVDEAGNWKSVPPSFNVWNGIKFSKGEPVEVSDKRMIAKAKRNHFFEVDGVAFDTAAHEADDED